VTCPDCYGTGQGHGRDLVIPCETCKGEGYVDGGWADDPDPYGPDLTEDQMTGPDPYEKWF
jgi:hypothetical protein